MPSRGYDLDEPNDPRKISQPWLFFALEADNIVVEEGSRGAGEDAACRLKIRRVVICFRRSMSFNLASAHRSFIVVACRCLRPYCRLIINAWRLMEGEVDGDLADTLALWWGMHVSCHGFTHLDFHLYISLNPRHQCSQLILAKIIDSQGY